MIFEKMKCPNCNTNKKMVESQKEYNYSMYWCADCKKQHFRWEGEGYAD